MKISELLKQYKEQQKQKRKLSFKHFAEDEIQIREFEGEYYFAFRGIPLFRVDTFSKYDLNNRLQDARQVYMRFSEQQDLRRWQIYYQ